jgi:predicted DNA-binding protein
MEKMLTELTVKMTLEMRRQLVGVADADGVPASQYVRELIMADLQNRRRKYLALSSVFSSDDSACQELSGVLEGDRHE